MKRSITAIEQYNMHECSTWWHNARIDLLVMHFDMKHVLPLTQMTTPVAGIHHNIFNVASLRQHQNALMVFETMCQVWEDPYPRESGHQAQWR